MVTLFECWNGGTVQWDQRNPPQFVFAFPPESKEVITFFQLSGRVCEILTNTEWHLNMAGELFDIPNLPSNDIYYFVDNIKNTMGYASTPIQYQLGNIFTGFVNVPLSLWVNMNTGRADMYNPFTGLIYGQQLLPPQSQFNIQMSTNFDMKLTQAGTVQGNGANKFMTSLTTGLGKGMGAALMEFIISGVSNAGDHGDWY